MTTTTRHNSAAKVDPAFIRRAVELADLNAVRVALFQQSGDPDIAALPVAAGLDAAGRELLISRAVTWLERNARSGMPALPPADELRRLMNLATGEEMGDLEFEARRDLPAFQPFPFLATWTDSRPELPPGFRVAIIGSGFCGLAMGVQLEQLGIPYVVLDRQRDPGGTWTIHRYPDIRVDTISITYEFPFEKNYPWKEYFSRGADVQSYLAYISKKYGVYNKTRFGHTVERTIFDEDRNVWNLEVSTAEGTVNLDANVLVNALGTFTNPKAPPFPGQEDFRGRIVHPSRWPADLDVTGKRVAVIGNGSTGVQLVAPVAQQAEQLYVFQRTPQWISPRDKYGKPVEPEVRWLLDNFPGYWNWWRYMAIAALFGTHGFLLPDPEWQAEGGQWNPMNDKLRDDLAAYIKAQTGGRKDLVDRLIPDYAPFSRRPVVDNGWYQALTRDNVELVTEGIERLTANGVQTAGGTVREVDVIVAAIGFDIIKYLAGDYRGVGGLDVHELWAKDGPRAYLGMLVPHFPNMFTLYGPNSQPLSGGTGLPIWYLVWASYSAKCIVRMLETGHSRVEVKRAAYDRYNEALDVEASELLLMHEYGAPEKNYYVNEFGRIQVSAPWYGPEFHRMCTEVDWDDIEIS